MPSSYHLWTTAERSVCCIGTRRDWSACPAIFSHSFSRLRRGNYVPLSPCAGPRGFFIVWLVWLLAACWRQMRRAKFDFYSQWTVTGRCTKEGPWIEGIWWCCCRRVGAVVVAGCLDSLVIIVLLRLLLNMRSKKKQRRFNLIRHVGQSAA